MSTPHLPHRWRPSLLAAILLLVGSAIPLPGRINPDTGPYGPDKLLHLLGHAGLTAALAAGLVASSGGAATARDGLFAVGLSTGFGLATEALQESVPGRSFETGDVLAGLVGSLVGALGWRRVRARAHDA